MNVKVINLNKLSDENFYKIITKTPVNELKELKTHLDHVYTNSPPDMTTMPDSKYDIIIKSIKKKDKSFILNVGHKPDKDEISHIWMGSLDKIKHGEDDLLTKFKKKFNKVLYSVDPKLDGCSVLWIPFTKKLFTRGDGHKGTDISNMIDHINIIDRDIVNKHHSYRGELVIKEKTFVDSFSEYSSSRNFVSSMILKKTIDEDCLKNIDLIIYETIDDNNFYKHYNNNMDILMKDLNRTKITSEQLTFDKLKSLHDNLKINCPYNIDGLVVHNDQLSEKNKDKNPKYMFAYKCATDSKETVITGIEWTISKNLLLKPVVQIEEININGVKIKNVTAYNARYVVENKLNIGSVVEVIRSGDVIPKIVRVVTPSETPLLPPDNTYKWSVLGCDIISNTDIDNVADIKRIHSFFVKLDVKSLGDKTITKIYNKGFNTIFKICDMEVVDYLTVPTIKDIMANKIFNNVRDALKNAKDFELLGASCMLGAGISILGASNLLTKFPSLLDGDGSELSSTSKTHILCRQNLEKAKVWLKEMEKFVDRSVVEVKDEEVDDEEVDDEEVEDEDDDEDDDVSVNKSAKKLKLQDRYITFSSFRDTDLKKKIKEHGGVFNEIMRANNTDVVYKVVYTKEGVRKKETGKVAEARKKGLNIYTYDEFVAMIC